MGQPAYIVLEEFACDDGAGAATVVGLRPRLIERSRGPDAMAMRLQEAYARGHADGEAAERAVADIKIAELVADHERRIERERYELSDALAQRLIADFAAGFDRARETLVSRLTSILVPVLKRSITETTIFGLADELARILDGDGAISIHMRGPEKIITVVLEALNARLSVGSDVAEKIRVTFSDDAEIRVEYGDAVIETRLAEWLCRIEEARGT